MLNSIMLEKNKKIDIEFYQTSPLSHKFSCPPPFFLECFYLRFELLNFT